MKSKLRDTIEHVISLERDKILVKQVQEGNSRSFSLLMQYYQGIVWSIGLSFFHNATDTEDFTQDVFVKAYVNIKSFKGESKFSTWLTRIAYNTAINSTNRKKEYESLAEESEVSYQGDSPEDEQIKKATTEAIREAVSELPEKYRVCLDFYFFYEMSHDEISAVTGLPVNTIKSHIFRAKKILYQKLKDFS